MRMPFFYEVKNVHTRFVVVVSVSDAESLYGEEFDSATQTRIIGVYEDYKTALAVADALNNEEVWRLENTQV